MTDTWELYHQTGPDGQEWGIKIRPGYIVTGFAREDAEAVVDWQNASCRPASDILERAKEYREAMRDNPDMPFAWGLIDELIAEVEASRNMVREFQNHEDQTHAEMEKIVGNSDNFIELTRQLKEAVERLRDFRCRIARVLGQSPSDCDDLLILGLDAAIKISKRQAARIEELEANLKWHNVLKIGNANLRAALNREIKEGIDRRRQLHDSVLALGYRSHWAMVKIKGLEESLAAEKAKVKRLEAVFLEAQYYMKFTEEEAREALERIRSGKDEN